MMEPINYDRAFAGVGPSASFAAAWCRKNEDREIDLIPCAEVGSSLDDWSVDAPLFEHAILQAKLAKRSGKLEGILWHQGENECSSGLSKLYNEKFLKIGLRILILNSATKRNNSNKYKAHPPFPMPSYTWVH